MPMSAESEEPFLPPGFVPLRVQRPHTQGPPPSGLSPQDQQGLREALAKVSILNWYIEQIEHLLGLSNRPKRFRQVMKAFRSDIEVGAMVHGHLRDY